MDKNLLIVGVGIYGLVAKEIAESMNCFSKISFIDDEARECPHKLPLLGTTDDLPTLAKEYHCVVVAIGNPEIRRALTNKIEKIPGLALTSLISPRAYVAPSARIDKGCIIEPMAVVNAGAALGKETFVCAGAVVNHAATCAAFVQVDCNATVAGNTFVPEGVKVVSGSVFHARY